MVEFEEVNKRIVAVIDANVSIRRDGLVVYISGSLHSEDLEQILTKMKELQAEVK